MTTNIHIYPLNPHNLIFSAQTQTIRFETDQTVYCSLFRTPHPSITRDIVFKIPEGTISKHAGKPPGMRLLDIGILSEAITKLKCNTCSTPLSLCESDFIHGWQTTFTIMCPLCHLLHAEFPFSKPMDLPAQSKYVNVHNTDRARNEVTIRSVLSVIGTYFPGGTFIILQRFLICHPRFLKCQHDVSTRSRALLKTPATRLCPPQLITSTKKSTQYPQP